MPTITGRTGADAMLKFLKLANSTMKRYRVKFLEFADTQWSEGHITTEQNVLIHNFVNTLGPVLDVVAILAEFTNVR